MDKKILFFILLEITGLSIRLAFFDYFFMLSERVKTYFIDLFENKAKKKIRGYQFFEYLATAIFQVHKYSFFSASDKQKYLNKINVSFGILNCILPGANVNFESGFECLKLLGVEGF